MCIDQLKQQRGFPIRTYVFKCNDCGSVFESNYNTEVECLNCQSLKTKRIYSPPSIVFKGKGFYKTDNERS